MGMEGITKTKTISQRQQKSKAQCVLMQSSVRTEPEIIETEPRKTETLGQTEQNITDTLLLSRSVLLTSVSKGNISILP